MISKTGTYWSTGITVHWSEHASRRDGVSLSGWGASLDFLDDGFANDDPDSGQVSTEGTLRSRYCVADGSITSGLSAAIDALLADAVRLGIVFRGVSGGDTPCLYYKGDGEWEDFPAPEGWRDILAREAMRIGWQAPPVAAQADRG